MPRLGGGTTGGNTGENKIHTRRLPLQISAYTKKLPKPNLRNILIALIGFFMLRNLLKNDYRREEMKYLREPSLSSTRDLEKALRMSEAERIKFVNARANDIETLKQDIHYLFKEVAMLRSKTTAKDTKKALNEREEGLKEMDRLHLQKRQEREEQLMKDHPDFVPSKRVQRDENGKIILNPKEGGGGETATS